MEQHGVKGPETHDPGTAADVPGSREQRSPVEGERSPWAQLASVAGYLHSDAVRRGERAELRRMRSNDIPPEIYWRLTDGLNWPREQAVFDHFWMTVLPLMTRNQHQPKARPGEVLAASGAKPPRVERWLRRDREAAWSEAGRLLSITRGTPIDWARFGYLLYAWDDPQVKLAFARDYFRAERRAGHAHTENEGDA